ncbi:MAG TPA: DNA primase [Patescibacteria group bacterium]|nr:DNA primase [Patescibacteria group bacterium]
MSDTDEIKARLNIVDIIGERVVLKKAGRNFKGLCPFHTEKTPSFIVSPDRQTFHCFGCGKGGDVLTFVMEYDHVDFTESLETLAERAGVKLERRPSDTPEAKLKQKILEVNHLASEYYQFLLTKHSVGEHARDYLKHRGVTDKSMKTFALGYSANDWEGLFSFLKKKNYDERLLETAGLVIRGNRGYYDRFRGRVMFTLKDHRGNVVGFSGRVMDPSAKEAKYINTSETPVYIKGKVLYALDVTKDAIQKANEAILMEGELDVISSFQAGIPNVVAIKGSAVTEDHARLLRRFSERLVFALDSDIAGDAAARRGIEIAEKLGFDMRVAHMPSGKDPDEAARENPARFKKALKDASPMYDYFFSSAFSRFDANSSYGKRKVSDELIPTIAKIDNPIIQAHYVRKLADSLGVSETSVEEGVTKYKATGARPVVDRRAEDSSITPRSRLEKAEIYAAALILQGKTTETFEEFIKEVPVSSFLYAPVRRILEDLEKFLSSHRIYLAKDFADGLPAPLQPTFDEAFLWEISEILSDEERFAREVTKTEVEVKKLHIRHRMEEIGQVLRDTRLAGSKHSELQRELKEKTQALALLEKGASVR